MNVNSCNGEIACFHNSSIRFKAFSFYSSVSLYNVLLSFKQNSCSVIIFNFALP